MDIADLNRHLVNMLFGRCFPHISTNIQRPAPSKPETDDESDHTTKQHTHD